VHPKNEVVPNGLADVGTEDTGPEGFRGGEQERGYHQRIDVVSMNTPTGLPQIEACRCVELQNCEIEEESAIHVGIMVTVSRLVWWQVIVLNWDKKEP
jgi:hypothetical protein